MRDLPQTFATREWTSRPRYLDEEWLRAFESVSIDQRADGGRHILRENENPDLAVGCGRCQRSASLLRGGDRLPRASTLPVLP